MEPIPQYVKRQEPTEDERLRALLGMSGLQGESDNLEEQLAQAIALRKPDTQQHYGLAGGLAHGLAGVLNNIGSYMQEGKIRPKLEDVQGRIGQAQQQQGEAYLNSLMQKRNPMGADDATQRYLPMMFGGGG